MRFLEFFGRVGISLISYAALAWVCYLAALILGSITVTPLGVSVLAVVAAIAMFVTVLRALKEPNHPQG